MVSLKVFISWVLVKFQECLFTIKSTSIAASYSLYAPISVHWEIGDAFFAMLKGKKWILRLAKLALKAYQEIPVKFIEVRLEQALELSFSLKTLVSTYLGMKEYSFTEARQHFASKVFLSNAKYYADAD